MNGICHSEKLHCLYWLLGLQFIKTRQDASVRPTRHAPKDRLLASEYQGRSHFEKPSRDRKTNLNQESIS